MHRIPSKGDLSSRAKQRPVMLGVVTAALFAASSLTSMAASVTYNFDTDPTQNLTINGNNDAVWVPTGGNPATGGFLALTYSQNDQNAAVLFPDIDEGKLVKAFKFEADLRVGNSSGDRGADGFSVSFARGNDPYVANPANVGGGFAGGGPAEFGTQTGIAVSFDTWSGNVLPDTTDIEGIIVRVDNVTINKTALPTRHGACDDNTSLQTGPRDAAYWDVGAGGLADPRDPGSWVTLCWQPFVIDLDDTGKLTVIWKGRTILDKFQTTYFPSVSRLVLAARTGGANEHTHFDNIKLTTVQADNPIVGLAVGDSCGFTIPIADAGTITPNESTITTTLNGAAFTPGIAREGANTILTFSPATPLAPASTNTIVVNFTTSTGVPISQTRTYIVPAATIVPASAATTQFTSTSSGFTFRVHQLELGRGPGDGNNIPNMENQLAGGFLNTDGTPRENQAFPSGTPSGLYEVPIINFEQNGGAAGNFTATAPEAAPRADELIPGIPGALGSTDNVAAEILTFLELKKGCVTLGFNSDDGFVANLGHSPFGPVLGSFGTGRGASDTLFRLLVDQDGVYPIRIAWSEGGGGANLEFFSVLPDGTKVLVNDPENPNAINAYSVGRGPGILQSIAPASGWTGANPNGPVVITFRDDLTTLNEGSVVVTIDGQTVTPTKTDSGALTTYRFAPTTPWAFGSSHTGSVVYSFGSGTTVTQDFTFGVRGIDIADLPAGFAIEAEHFDYDSGQHVTTVDVNPYEGGEYNGLGAIRDTDYRAPDNGPFTNGNPDGYNYRTGIPAEPAPSANRFVPMDANATAGTLDTLRPGGWEVTTNFKIGWIGDEWYNYTRVITNGNYKIVGAQSHGESLANQRVARFGVVVAGAGTPNQTVIEVGRYSEPGTGGWGNNALAMVKQNGQDTVVNLGGTQTLRVWADSGDFDWFALIPTTEATPPPGVTSVSPANGSFSVANALSLDITDVLRALKINFSSVRLNVNGTDVTSSAQVTDTVGGVNVRYQPSAGFVGGTTYNYTLTFTDTSNATRTFEGSFTSAYSAQAFVIEAEDFNHGGGQTVAAASTMPLQAGLYNNLGAVHDVDYHVIGVVNDSPLYRIGENPPVPMDLNNGDLNRGPFSVTQSYKIGWIDNGEWFNYTRTFPQDDYLVFASISHGGTAATDFTGGALDLVTAGATETNQTVQALGTFRADGPTGGWGVNRLVPLRDGSGNPVAVTLGGTQTVRYTAHNGDYNYLLFIPAEGVTPAVRITGVTRSGNNLTITWTGGGNLYQADALNADGSATWTAVTGAGAGTATVSIAGGMKFFMIRP